MSLDTDDRKSPTSNLEAPKSPKKNMGTLKRPNKDLDALKRLKRNMDAVRVVLLLLVLTLVTSLFASFVSATLDPADLVGCYVTIGVSTILSVLLGVYMYMLYHSVKGPGQNKTAVGMARFSSSTVLSTVSVVQYVLWTNVYAAIIAESDRGWVRTSNAAMAGVFVLLYAVLFPLVIPRVCPSDPAGNAAWRIVGLWPTWAIAGGKCTRNKRSP